MKTIALFGAAGKIGSRIAGRLRELPDYEILYVENGEAGIQRLRERGLPAITTSEVEGRPLGKGMLDVKGLLDILRCARYDFNIILEQWPPEQKTLQETICLEQEWAVESVAYLKKLTTDL
jgi:hypothetical protein